MRFQPRYLAFLLAAASWHSQGQTPPLSPLARFEDCTIQRQLDLMFRPKAGETAEDRAEQAVLLCSVHLDNIRLQEQANARGSGKDPKMVADEYALHLESPSD